MSTRLATARFIPMCFRRLFVASIAFVEQLVFSTYAFFFLSLLRVSPFGDPLSMCAESDFWRRCQDFSEKACNETKKHRPMSSDCWSPMTLAGCTS